MNAIDATEKDAIALGLLSRMTNNVVAAREKLFSRFNASDNKNIDGECGYPVDLDISLYRTYYDREGIPQRLVSILPDESWQLDPTVLETEDEGETVFEKALAALLQKHHLYHYLHRVDDLSGIGSFGVLLFGINDGLEMNQPVAGFEKVEPEEAPAPVDGAPVKKLLYIRPFDQSLVTIKNYETDVTSPRYGLPTMYSINFFDTNSLGMISTSADVTTKDVHWSRVLHVADNRKSSEVFGEPRLQNVFNRCYDLRKILSGSGEMFWKGAFPGLAFEANDDTVGDITTMQESLAEEMEKYGSGLKRWLGLIGMKAKSLAPNIKDPNNAFETQVKAIALSKKIPYRILMGSESAQLASGQDAKAWNKRIAGRQTTYVTPRLLRPAIDRLIQYGVLPPVEKYVVQWPDLNEMSDAEKAEVAAKRVEALAKFVAGNVHLLYPPLEFFQYEMGMTQERAQSLIEAAGDRIELLDPPDPDKGDGDPSQGGQGSGSGDPNAR